jgi:cell division protein FtsL
VINDSEETEVVEDTPVVKPRFTPVIVLSVLLGMLMTVVAVGSLLSYQRGRAVNAEMQALKNELKERNRVHDDLQTQIEALSRQMAVLKEYSVARSSAAVRAREAKPEAEAKANADATVVQSPPPVAVGAPPVSDKPAASDKLQVSAPAVSPPAVSPPPEPPRVKRSKPEGQSCELVGKSAEEQAAILKRCVGLMDAPKDAKSR